MLDPSGMDWPDLVTLAQRGNVDAIGALYDQHHAALFRYLFSRLGERQTAEDLTGDVFMRMLTALPHYQPSQTPFRAWLYRIARNRLIDHYRKEGPHTPVPLPQAEEQQDHTEDLGLLADQKMTTERVLTALSQLEATQREVVALRFLSELSLQEVAETLEKSENAIKALQHRGLAALRQALAQEQVLS